MRHPLLLDHARAGRVEEVRQLLAEETPDVDAADATGRTALMHAVEAGNEEYRRKHLKKRTTDRIIIEAFDNCREVGVETVASNIATCTV